MGDGRYYTYDQFFNVIFLTVAIIFLEVCFMINLFKGSKYKSYMITSGLGLTWALVARFVEEVAYKSTIINLYHYIYQGFIGLYIIGFAGFFYSYFKKEQAPLTMGLIGGIFLVVPSCMFIFIGKFEVIFLSLFIVNYVVVSSRLINYRVSGSVFAKVKKSLLDDVFITSIQGDIIYKSDRAQASEFFNSDRVIHKNNFHDFFRRPILIREAFDKQIIKVKHTPGQYFHHSEKTIEDSQGVAGYIHTFTDISGLVAILDELKTKEDESRAINGELTKYKAIVYDLERQKEVNALLDDIANSQQLAMVDLKHAMADLDFNDALFISKINGLIHRAKEDLSNVRDHVTAYRHYYSKGGLHDKNHDC